MTDLFDCRDRSYLEMHRKVSILEEDLLHRLGNVNHELSRKCEMELKLLNEQRRVVMKLLYNRGTEDRKKMIG